MMISCLCEQTFTNGACAHYVMVSKMQWKPFWLAIQFYPQNDWTGWQKCVNDDVFAQAPSDGLPCVDLSFPFQVKINFEENDRTYRLKWLMPIRRRRWRLIVSLLIDGDGITLWRISSKGNAVGALPDGACDVDGATSELSNRWGLGWENEVPDDIDAVSLCNEWAESTSMEAIWGSETNVMSLVLIVSSDIRLGASSRPLTFCDSDTSMLNALDFGGVGSVSDKTGALVREVERRGLRSSSFMRCRILYARNALCTVLAALCVRNSPAYCAHSSLIRFCCILSSMSIDKIGASPHVCITCPLWPRLVRRPDATSAVERMMLSGADDGRVV